MGCRASTPVPPPDLSVRQTKVCIIGAGPAGLHLAHVLRRSHRIRDIVVLDRAPRIGGKATWTQLGDQGMWHSAGALIAQNHQTVIGLTRNLGFDAIQWVHPKTETSWFAADDEAGEPFSPSQGSLNWKVKSAIRRYVRLHTKLLGKYSGVLPPRPPALDDFEGSFAQFLARHDLSCLLSPCRVVLGAFLDSTPETVPVLYGLLACTPIEVKAVMSPHREEWLGICNASKLVDCLRQDLEEDSGFQVQMEADVQKIERTSRGVMVHFKQDGKQQIITVDKLVVACDPRVFPFFMDSSKTEERLLRSLKGSNVATTLAHVFGNLSEQKCCLRQCGQDVVIQTAVGGTSATGKTYIFRQPSSSPVEDDALSKELVERLEVTSHGPSKVEILRHSIWADRALGWSSEDIMKGYIWRLWDIQGQNNTLYCGSYAALDTLEGVLAYNEQLSASVIEDWIERNSENSTQ